MGHLLKSFSMFFHKVRSVFRPILGNREFVRFPYKKVLVGLSLRLVSALAPICLRDMMVVHDATQHSNIPG